MYPDGTVDQVQQPDDAREYIKALAPWIKDDQIEYDSEMNPVSVSGAHTPFPPFHWKCRTGTSLIYIEYA